MAERIQLKEPGSELLMVVSSVKAETVERNEYYLFTNGKVELLVPQSSVKGRLERLGVSAVENLVGKTVRFARSLKMSRANAPYWDIDVVSMSGVMPSGAEQSAGGEMGKPTTGTSAGAPSASPAPDKPKMRDAYKDLTKWVLREIAPLYKEAGLDVSPVAMAACCQTLFIQACNAGKVE